MASDTGEVEYLKQRRREELYEFIWEEIKPITEKEQTAGREESSKHAIPSPSIYEVPSKLREQNENAYIPRVVAIGPRHRWRLHESMMNHKFRYMQSLFGRTCLPTTGGQPESDHTFQIMKKCVDSMLNYVEAARNCYEGRCERYIDERGDYFTDEAVAKMMVVDGCFIIELVYSSQLRQKLIGDPILGNTLVLVDVKHDLLLLENQIPFFVLEDLFEHTVSAFKEMYRGFSLTRSILDFFGNMIDCHHPLPAPSTDRHDHILGLLHHCYLPRCSTEKLPDIEANESQEEELGDEYQQINYSATSLDRAGVNFHALTTDLLNVNFSISCWFPFACGKRTSENPTCYVYAPTTSSTSSTSCFLSWLCRCCGINRFEISPICLYDTTESFLRNLIAYEYCKPGVKQHMTSYVYLMHTIINTKEDVDLLVKAKVLENNLRTSEDALNLFNHVCKEVIMDEFLFALPWKAVHEHCKRYTRRNLPSVVKRNCASFTRFYFSSRWAFLSVSAALILFVLQVMQTVYTIRSSK